MARNWMVLVAAVAISSSAPPAFTDPARPALVHETPIDSFHRWSEKDLVSLIQKPNVSVGLSDHESFFVDTIMRDRQGMVEVHDRWNDYLVILKGDGVIAYGGKAVDLKEVSPGEWRAAMMKKETTVSVHSGDLVVIPAGMTHQMRLEAGVTIRYLAFKARQ